MVEQSGGCLCGEIRYRVTAQPLRVSFCHCRYCQKARGGAYAVEPIFDKDSFELTAGTPRCHDTVSSGSGKVIHNNFCATCGSGVYYSFERYQTVVGLHAGTFDTPDWFEWGPDNAKHIFLSSALPGTVIPAGIPTFQEHAITQDGEPIAPVIYDEPFVIPRR